MIPDQNYHYQERKTFEIIAYEDDVQMHLARGEDGQVCLLDLYTNEVVAHTPDGEVPFMLIGSMITLPAYTCSTFQRDKFTGAIVPFSRKSLEIIMPMSSLKESETVAAKEQLAPVSD